MSDGIRGRVRVSMLSAHGGLASTDTTTAGPGFCSSTGGSDRFAAHTAEMRTTASLLDRCGDVAQDTLRGVVVAGFDLPLSGALLSPGSAADITGQMAALTVGPSGIGALVMKTEVLARLLRLSANLYDQSEKANQLLMSGVEHAIAPFRLVYEVPATGVNYLGRRLGSEHDELPGTSGLTDDLLTTLHIGLSRSVLPGLSLEQQLTILVGHGQRLGFFHDSVPLKVNQIPPQVPDGEGPKNLGGLAADIDAGGRGPQDRERILVRHVQQPDGSGAWIVSIPGTAQWSPYSQENPADFGANLRLVAGMPSSLLPAVQGALGAAMRQAGVTPGTQPVLLTGHSQGGIVAARLGQDKDFVRTFNVREVVTFASPVSRMDLPEGVHGLEINNKGDIVPRTEAQEFGGARNRAQITCEEPDEATNDLSIHNLHEYIDRSERYLGTDTKVPAAQEFYGRSTGVFLGGTTTSYQFELQRPMGQ